MCVCVSNLKCPNRESIREWREGALLFNSKGPSRQRTLAALMRFAASAAHTQSSKSDKCLNNEEQQQQQQPLSLYVGVSSSCEYGITWIFFRSLFRCGHNQPIYISLCTHHSDVVRLQECLVEWHSRVGWISNTYFLFVFFKRSFFS